MIEGMARARVGQPVGAVDADAAEGHVDEPDVGVEDEAPDDRDRHDAGDDRQVEADPEQRPEPVDPAVEGDRRGQPEDQGQRDADDDEVGGVEERGPELRVAEQLDVVVEADEVRPERIAQVTQPEVGEARGPATRASGPARNTRKITTNGSANAQPVRFSRSVPLPARSAATRRSRGGRGRLAARRSERRDGPARGRGVPGRDGRSSGRVAPGHLLTRADRGRRSPAWPRRPPRATRRRW